MTVDCPPLLSRTETSLTPSSASSSSVTWATQWPQVSPETLRVVVRSMPSAVNSVISHSLGSVCGKRVDRNGNQVVRREAGRDAQDRTSRAMASEASRILAVPSSSPAWAACRTQWLMWSSSRPRLTA